MGKEQELIEKQKKILRWLLLSSIVFIFRAGPEVAGFFVGNAVLVGVLYFVASWVYSKIKK